MSESLRPSSQPHPSATLLGDGGDYYIPGQAVREPEKVLAAWFFVATETEAPEVRESLRYSSDAAAHRMLPSVLALRDWVFRFLLSTTRRLDLVEEILNDVLFTVWQKAGNFGERSRPSTWIFGIAYRKALKRLAREGRIPPQVTPEAAGLSGLAGAEGAAQRHELRDLLQRALERLSPDQRAVIELTYYGGHSCREVAEIVDCPVNTVKTRMFHARLRLRKLLPPLGRGPIGARSTGEQG